MALNLNGRLPETICLDSDYIWEQLSPENMTFELCKPDREAIVESVLAKFLSVNDPDVTDFHVQVPDFNRMRDRAIEQDPDRLQQLLKAVQRIEQNLYVNFTENGIFEENKQFSYMFDRFLGNTIVIFKLPH